MFPRLSWLLLPGVLLLGTARPEAMQSDFDRALQTLPGIVVDQKTARYAGKGAKVRQLDVIDTRIEVGDGVEQYESVLRNNRECLTPSRITGLWSFGEIANLLRTTRDGVAAQGKGANPALFRFAASSRRWFVVVESQVYWLDFEGRVWSEPDTGKLIRVSWISDPLPPATGIDQVLWSVDFKPVDIAGRNFELPETALYRVTRKGGGSRAEWNVTRFLNYARYGSESHLRFSP